jgi:hypothetical protein
MLPTEVVLLIEQSVAEVFQRARDRFLGPYSVTGRNLFVGFDRALSLPGIIETAAIEEGFTPRRDHLDSLIAIARNYLDGAEARAKAQVLHSVESWVREHRQTDKNGDEIRNALGMALADVWGEIKTTMRAIFDTETQRAKSVTLAEGIAQAQASLGIDDPTVFFVIVRDLVCCSECWKIHMLADRTTPRVWKLSEISHEYHKRGDDFPSIMGLHPNCRCTLAPLLPGFGFNKSGYVTWKGEGWDEYAHQRGLV